MANKKYAKLDQLTTAELESILRADLSDVESDPELIDHVLEVILEREQEESDSSSSDRARARADFEKLYKGLNEPLLPYPQSGQLVPATSSPSTSRAVVGRSVVLYSLPPWWLCWSR